ncbi:uncharacterized protein LOC132757745 [Ruditapes philippinarum]|uniref:uncharacterized protein LOC132757745 n=1 Tax=Ruditapes philippinarum TaxID=129788 RepID=UPI00295AC2F5|nr:uncharacterized protein LOC132757745 [Ruditapes philippinarum]
MAKPDKQTSLLSFLKSSNSDVNNNFDGETPSSPKKAKIAKAVFQHKWLKSYFWLKFDDNKNEMYCDFCRNLHYCNTMALGTSNFKTTTLQRHAASSDHHSAVSNKSHRQQFKEAVLNADSKESKSIMLVMKVVYWLAKECIPLTKYSSLMELLQFLETPNMSALKVGEKVNYSSYKTACDIFVLYLILLTMM